MNIKQWIDDREVLTERELAKVTGLNRASYQFSKWWGYVLDTKNPVKLKEYREQKINKGMPKRLPYDRIKEIYNNDMRLQRAGFKTGSKLLKNIYGISISQNTYRIYRKTLCSNLTQKD